MDEISKRAIFSIFLISGGVFVGLSIFVLFHDPYGWFLVWPLQVFFLVFGGLLISLFIVGWRKKIFIFNS